jgi:lipoyl(octanoyl) transferase
VHDAEVTYSLSVPTNHLLAADPETLYRRMHGSLVRLLGELGIAAQLNEPALVPLGSTSAPLGEPFLCFHRRAVGDVLVGEHKICGSAQRRRKGAVLQHGGVLLARSAAAPELPGLAQLAAGVPDAQAFIRAWVARFEADIHPCRPAEPYTAAEQERIEFFRAGKYADESWTNRR